MKEQSVIIENCNTFEPKDIFECGQCFRWEKEVDGSYTGVVGKAVLNVKKENQNIMIEGVSRKKESIKEIVMFYFDLERDYEKIKKKLSNLDSYMKESIQYGQGIRILNQDLWETIISFIISANNNIPRIKGIIERMAKQYGQELIFRNKTYYTFPSVEELAKVEVEDLRKLGLGFRDIRVYETTKMIHEGRIKLEELEKEKDFVKLRNTLLILPGVGPKVADCILLFSTLKRWEVFPIDVWVRRVMNDLYIHEQEESKVKKEQIEKIAYEKFGSLAGIAQQYLFYWKREIS